MTTMAAVLPLLALAWLSAALIGLAPRKPGYSQLRHTISELGEIGAPDERLVAWGLFLPIGLVFALDAFLMEGPAPAAATTSLCIAVGYLVAAAFPCDPGSPVSGSTRQGVHNLGGAVEYIGGGVSLLAAARAYGEPVRIAGMIVLVVAAALTLLPAAAMRGLMQRIGEVTLFGATAWMAWASGHAA